MTRMCQEYHRERGAGPGRGGVQSCSEYALKFIILCNCNWFLIFCLWFVIRKCKIYLFSLSHGCCCCSCWWSWSRSCCCAAADDVRCCCCWCCCCISSARCCHPFTIFGCAGLPACCLQLSRSSFYLCVCAFLLCFFCWFCNCLTEIGWERILFVLHGKMNLNAWIQNVTWTKTLCKEFHYNYYVLFFLFIAFHFSFFWFFYIG